MSSDAMWATDTPISVPPHCGPVLVGQVVIRAAEPAGTTPADPV